MSTIEENKNLKREKILSAAYELFSKKGIQKTAIDEVVKRAEIAKGTFYLYFKSKYDLLDMVIIEKSEQLIKILINKLKEKNNTELLTPVEQLLFFTDLVLDAIEEHKNIFYIISEKKTLFLNTLTSNSENMETDYIIEIFKQIGFSEERAKKILYLLFCMTLTACENAIINQKPFSQNDISPEIHFIIKAITETQKKEIYD
ncbi:MAG: TetR/AcrR family transcriptional regulator [Candidatus Fimenecus sp.]